jgi:hypothetical protein
MKNIRNVIDHEIKWFQPRTFKMEYELQDDGELAATLRFRSSFGSLATGESADGCWTFKRMGFWQTRATIRRCGSDEEIAVFRNNTWSNGGTLELPDGRRYLANTNFWATEYEFTTEAGESLVTYRRISGLLHLSSMVEIQPLAVSLDELPWLVMLGWYLTVMMQMDSAALVAASA